MRAQAMPRRQEDVSSTEEFGIFNCGSTSTPNFVIEEFQNVESSRLPISQYSENPGMKSTCLKPAHLPWRKWRTLALNGHHTQREASDLPYVKQTLGPASSLPARETRSSSSDVASKPRRPTEKVTRWVHPMRRNSSCKARSPGRWMVSRKQWEPEVR